MCLYTRSSWCSKKKRSYFHNCVTTHAYVWAEKTNNLVFLVIYIQNKSRSKMTTIKRVKVYYKCIVILVKMWPFSSLRYFYSPNLLLVAVISHILFYFPKIGPREGFNILSFFLKLFGTRIIGSISIDLFSPSPAPINDLEPLRLSDYKERLAAESSCE